MEEEFVRPQRERAGKILLVTAALLVLAAAGLWCLVFGYNRFSLEIRLDGDEQIAVEYGEEYREPGGSVILRGSKFWTDGILLETPLETVSELNVEKLGKNNLSYRASFFGMEATASRVVRVIDTECPQIFLTPDPEDLAPAVVYQEAGYSAYDNYDGDITDRVVRTEEEGKIIYTVLDSSGNPTEVEREVPILDTLPPQITLLGGDVYHMRCGQPYVDPGFSAWDRRDGDLTAQVTAACDQEIIRYRTGEYTVSYRVSDSSGNEAEAYRRVIVDPSSPPTIRYPEGKTIYLTFDDGPCPDTARLLDVLKRYQVPATFFVVDTGYPELMRRIVDEGHSIGIHTKSHVYRKIYADAESYFADLLGMQEIIREATGVETWLLRFPGGSSNTVSHFSRGIMTELTAAVEAAGFAYFDWNVDSDDAGHATRSREVLRNVQDGVLQNTYNVVLQHDIHDYSVSAVESIIRWGLENGYTFRALEYDSPSAHHGVRN